MSRITTVLSAVVALALTLALSACGAAGSGAGADTSAPLRLLADVKPHAELLKEVERLGLLGDTKIEVREISGDIDVNRLTQDGDVDANFFQHTPYLTDWNKKNSGTLVEVAKTHIEPLGLYSEKVASVDAIPQGATIAIPLDTTNQARALFLLQDAGLLTLNAKPTDAGIDYTQITTKSITANPKNVTFVTIDRPQLAATLKDPKITLSIINGNYAIEAGLNPAKDAKALEKAANNPYVNVLVTSEKLKDDPRVKKLAEALQSQQIADYITKTYSGSVLPAKG